MANYVIIEKNNPKRHGAMMHDVYRDNRLWRSDLTYTEATQVVYDTVKEFDTVSEYYETSGGHPTKRTGSQFKREIDAFAEWDKHH